MTVWSHVLLMGAAWSQCRSGNARRRRGGDTRKRSFSLLPYVALWGTFAVLVVTLVVNGLDVRAWVAIAGLGACTGMVVARQLTAFIDNAALLRERDVLAARLHTMAFTDSLTGQANRAQFLEQVDGAFGRGEAEMCVLLIDLDDFKPVNDVYGHAGGDAVLSEVAARIRASVWSADVVARLGGDEFVVLLTEPGRRDLTAVADEIVQAVGRPCHLACGEQVRVGASIGVAVAGSDGQDAAAMMAKADEAMYAAKCAGKGSYRLASAS
ncbi:diguanylate cyclase [Actinoplanes sp. CA-030573]|uniref:diguanylate cyclase n=1 Tax=Actinoplanes sp. CA-030573 TaxID=3239898 RepID=UPI003D8A7232